MTAATEVTEAERVSEPESSGTGLEPNVAGALAYLFAPVGGVVLYLVESEDAFVRFHARQSIAFGLAMMVVWMGTAVGAWVLGAILNNVPVVGGLLGLLTGLLFPVVGLVGFAVWAYLTYRAYQGDRFRIPVLGSFANPE